ncbi:hypothetical protein RchiOBHm_Chr5g0021281 [Rosa chinensis]|uniref:Secreted protein n=1 Tax=Rosa chinensis TaxID=74649 RepID=A0A2P6Q7J3_ROSCH|nr:hypothetical protein RchiOBHm_Chr5g0021281 [Rosa chinensis]
MPLSILVFCFFACICGQFCKWFLPQHMIKVQDPHIQFYITLPLVVVQSIKQLNMINAHRKMHCCYVMQLI